MISLHWQLSPGVDEKESSVCSVNSSQELDGGERLLSPFIPRRRGVNPPLSSLLVKSEG